MTIYEKADLVERLRSYDIEQYKNSKALIALTNALMHQAQHIENVATDMTNRRSLATAEGKTLDDLGTIVDEDRKYKDDEDYRIAILSKAVRNSGGGTAEDVIAVVKTLYNVRKIEYKDTELASFSMFVSLDESEEFESEEETARYMKRVQELPDVIKSVSPLAVSLSELLLSTKSRVFGFVDIATELDHFVTNKPPPAQADVKTTTSTKTSFLVTADSTETNNNVFGFGEDSDDDDELSGFFLEKLI
jgi:hypothetical protein